MSKVIQQLVERSFEMYRRGRYMALMGSTYADYVCSKPVEELVEELLEQSGYATTLEIAFADHAPLEDEVYLYILERSSVVTNQRIFLIADGRLSHPPIPLTEIESYSSTGFWTKREHIALVDGTEIDRKTDAAVDDDTMAKLVEAARDPGKAAGLSSDSMKTPVSEKAEPGTHDAEPIDPEIVIRLGDIDGLCVSCNQAMNQPDDQQQAWALVRAAERKEKSVRCLGFPLGWELFVDGIKVSPVARFSTAVCPSCAATLRQRVTANAESQRQEQDKKRKEDFKLNASLGVAAISIAAICFFSGWYFSAGAWAYWVGAIFGVISIFLLMSMFEPTGKTEGEIDEIVDQEIQAVQDEAILAAIGDSPHTEILRDDQPSDMAGKLFVVTETVLNHGDKSGWTLFKCWGIMDEPGGTRRDDMTTEHVRVNDFLHQDIGEWLASETE